MVYDNETTPNVPGAVPGDASPAVLYGPRFTVLNIQQVPNSIHALFSLILIMFCIVRTKVTFFGLHFIFQSSAYPGGLTTITVQVATSVTIQLNEVRHCFHR